MSRSSDFRPIILSLWFRLITLGIIALVFAEVLVLAPGKAQGWTYYLTTSEVIFEVVVRLTYAALAGIALGTICVAVLAPFLYFSPARQRVSDWATNAAVVLVIFLDSRLALITLIGWSSRASRFESALLPAYLVAFAIALCIPRTRREVVTSLDPFLGGKMTRRTVIAAVAGTAALVATEFALGKRLSRATLTLAQSRPKSNFLLISFDALSAEDMSLYGYRLPTTPNIDAFARKGTVFTNYYSASTFTTPSVAAMMTGIYPSENHVHQLQGQLGAAENAGKNLLHAMRAAGYATGAFYSNPYAYYLGEGLQNAYDVLPQPTFQQGGVQHVWDATTPLHQHSGFGSRTEEYCDLTRVWDFFGKMPYNLRERYRAVDSFRHAREVLAELPDGFFLWVHVMTPHGPYLPDAPDRGRFHPDKEPWIPDEDTGTRWKPRYEPDQQSQVSERRLRYDEFIATADREFGSFISHVENSGRLPNTTVIVSADHGESFEGGVYQHASPYQTRPMIHIPLIIRTPGQQDNREVAFTADQTTLAPTILDLAGQPKPDWLPGQSLAKWLTQDHQSGDEGLAFCQYLEKNSVFRPLRHGSAGVIDGRSQYQYVVDLDTQKGSLRPLNQAQIWNIDRTSENPALAETLRAALYSRFPELVQRPT